MGRETMNREYFHEYISTEFITITGITMPCAQTALPGCSLHTFGAPEKLGTD